MARTERRAARWRAKPGGARLPGGRVFEDAGFLHGDGVFETVRVVGGRPLFWARHRERLARGLAHLGIEVDLGTAVDPLVLHGQGVAGSREGARPQEGASQSAEPARAGEAGDTSTMESERRDPVQEERLRVTVSRGPLLEVGRGGPATVHVTRGPLAPAEAAARLVLVSVVRPGPTALPPFVKPLSYLPFVLARREARTAGGTDALLLDSSGNLAECDCASLFFSLGRTLFTPGASTGRLEGITRAIVLEEAARLGIPVVEGRQPLRLLERATEIFVTSSLRGIRPVTEVTFPGSSWQAAAPGPLTARLMSAYADRLTAETTPAGPTP